MRSAKSLGLAVRHHHPAVSFPYGWLAGGLRPTCTFLPAPLLPGFSEVQVATDRAIRYECACKSMPLPPPDSAVKAERNARMAIMREISAMLGLEHPNVVGLREYFVQKNRIYLIMELLRGEQANKLKPCVTALNLLSSNPATTR